MCDPSLFPSTDPNETEYAEVDEAYLAQTILQEYVSWESDHRGSPEDEALTMRLLALRLSWLPVREQALTKARITLWKQHYLRLRYRRKPDQPNLLNGSGYEYIVD